MSRNGTYASNKVRWAAKSAASLVSPTCLSPREKGKVSRDHVGDLRNGNRSLDGGATPVKCFIIRSLVYSSRVWRIGLVFGMAEHTRL